MRWRLFGVVAGALVLLLLTGVAGCNSGVPPAQWAGQVCSAVKPWRAEIADLNAQAQQQMLVATTPEQTRTTLLALLAGGQDVSETARKAVAAAGVPAVNGGDQVAREFVDTLARARDAYAHAHADLQDLSLADASLFYDGVTAVLTRLQAEYAAGGLDTSKLDSPELQRAFDGVDQCR